MSVLSFRRRPESLLYSLSSPPVDLLRVPHGGIQPAIDRGDVMHMVYLAGEPRAANVFYVRSSDSGKTFSRAVRVNSQDGCAIATGTIRGAQVAVGRNGRVHVAWNGSDKALPKPPVDRAAARAGTPMLYARSNESGTITVLNEKPPLLSAAAAGLEDAVRAVSRAI